MSDAQQADLPDDPARDAEILSQAGAVWLAELGDCYEQIGVLRRLIVDDPNCGDRYIEPTCIFCEGSSGPRYGVLDHATDCPWVLARALPDIQS